MKNPDIKIFVSHRVDLDSAIVHNPVYHPILCGSCYMDKELKPGFERDDTGDNISNRRMTFCEVTIQYWAWKNVQADYYGLCHYRRYLAFKTPRVTQSNQYGHLMAEYPFPHTQKAYGLLDRAHMEQVIASCDILAAKPAQVAKIKTPKGYKHTVKEHWAAYDNQFIKAELLDMLLDLVDKHAPQYSASAREYYASDKIWGFNCYVMQKRPFEELCEFQFPILFELEKRLDMTGYTETMRRSPGFASEILYGIFLYHHQKQQDYTVKTLPLVYFKETRADYSLPQIAWSVAKRDVPEFINWKLLPYGSRRRAFLKNALQTLHIIKPDSSNNKKEL